ncbi:uncharacterized protein SCHCODRAFT_02614673 [Schizophyllum commune H4-8]|uniref:uncharacterized protein n=1 Tax=Schizophyllum commune (strain H4-8 / FGSC 9210) TaxID=578458 RepID=UPI00215F8BF1|nr:uncharacterized protein SCHCODRAFT_02614673 [Schizophyllum commune H4-8]KAI5896379.1 hypothetical protein SCHCODRAFT_02614673 [Schizophyllum commune H4-8]
MGACAFLRAPVCFVQSIAINRQVHEYPHGQEAFQGIHLNPYEDDDQVTGWAIDRATEGTPLPEALFDRIKADEHLQFCLGSRGLR